MLGINFSKIHCTMGKNVIHFEGLIQCITSLENEGAI